VLGTAVCVVLYLAINVAYLRAMPLAELAKATDPARATAVRLGGGAAGGLLSPLVAVCVLSSLQATVLVGPRVYHAMAIDGVFFRPLGRLHANTGAPVVALGVQGVIAVVELVTGRFDQLLAFAMFAIVSFSIFTTFAVFVLRVRRPSAARPFRVPGYPFVPGLFVAVNAWVLWNVFDYGGAQGHRAALYGLGIVATGVPAYVAFRSRNHPQETAR
jgi:APA family basic amino acid/polyamine antiporter